MKTLPPQNVENWRLCLILFWIQLIQLNHLNCFLQELLYCKRVRLNKMPVKYCPNSMSNYLFLSKEYVLFYLPLSQRCDVKAFPFFYSFPLLCCWCCACEVADQLIRPTTARVRPGCKCRGRADRWPREARRCPLQVLQ